ncbi:nuclear transport factor 2 family protein [Georgenia ruanii]|uniref:SnoaL-like domain-containing protein n=1 Tax=Georgenia ruanii TaxID=348442 RepID=A0A7J9UV78_9MICO|nr:nuclear transport factor 2 family protein [Georgenia ruanii]MPV88535.1 hypothetical protein [Georgenia ruanii]
MNTEEKVQWLTDRALIKESIYRYAAMTDDKQWPQLRALMDPEVVAVYAGHDTLVGVEAVIEFIQRATERVVWGHHKLSVAYIDFDGDEAKALTYHTSHSVVAGDPDTVVVKVARYQDTLRRDERGSWRFIHKLMEPGWNEKRQFEQRR